MDRIVGESGKTREIKNNLFIIHGIHLYMFLSTKM